MVRRYPKSWSGFTSAIWPSDWLSASCAGALSRSTLCSLNVQESALGDPECLVDGFVQVGTLVLAQQVVGLVTDDDIAVSGNPHLNMHNRRNGPGEILVALIDPHPARGQPVIASLQLGDPGANFLLYGWRAFEVVKRDFKRNLQHCISIGLALFMRLLTLDHAESLP